MTMRMYAIQLPQIMSLYKLCMGSGRDPKTHSEPPFDLAYSAFLFRDSIRLSVCDFEQPLTLMSRII